MKEERSVRFKSSLLSIGFCRICPHAEMPSPRAMKSHINYNMMPGGEPAKSPAKYIYVARNPIDVAVSLFYHTRRMVCFEFT